MSKSDETVDSVSSFDEDDVEEEEEFDFCEDFNVDDEDEEESSRLVFFVDGICFFLVASSSPWKEMRGSLSSQVAFT